MLRKDPFITGEYYHIYNRGVDKRIIFKSSLDYERFMMLLYIANSSTSFRLDELLNRQSKSFKEILALDKDKPLVSIGVWCLMPNHFHILMRQEVDGGITKFMRKLGVGYSMYFNIKYERQGALFSGPFKSKLIGVDDNYFRHLLGYIHLNPLDTKFSGWQEMKKLPEKDMRKFLESYEYSSYTEYLHKKRGEGAILNIKTFPEYFRDVKDFKDFIKNYFIETEQ